MRSRGRMLRFWGQSTRPAWYSAPSRAESVLPAWSDAPPACRSLRPRFSILTPSYQGWLRCLAPEPTDQPRIGASP